MLAWIGLKNKKDINLLKITPSKVFIPVNILTIQNVNIYSLDVNVIPEFLLVGEFSSNRKT